MAKAAKKSKVKSLPARSLTAKQAKRVKGGLLPAVNVAQKVMPGDGSVLKQTPGAVRGGKWE